MKCGEGLDSGTSAATGNIASCERGGLRLNHPLPVPGQIKEAYDKNPKLAQSLLDDISR